MSSSPPKNDAEKLVQLNTHQAKNLEALKNESQWFRGRVESIDLLLTERGEHVVQHLQGINRKLWHVVFWLYFWSIIAIVGAFFSMADPY